MKKYLFAALASLALIAAAIPKTAREELLQDFSGGLNTTDPSHKLATNFSPFMRNVFIDSGRIERINGFQTLGSTTTLTKVTGIYPFARESGQTTFLVTDSSVTLETSDFSNWTFVSSGSNTGALLFWMQVRNKMWGFNGVDAVMTWDGTSKVALNGLGSTPNVPKFRYGAYYLDRVWGFGGTTGASDLFFSATLSTDNAIIAPDHKLAWPSNFATFVGRGDGQNGTALWVYQGLLRAGKEQSIYTIFGDLPDNFIPRKEEANVGVVSQETVRVLDGQTHFLGPTGVYRNVERISDNIEPDVEEMNKGASSILTNQWETQADFARGQFFNTTGTAAGFVRSFLDGDVHVAFSAFPDPPSSVFSLTSVSTFIPNAVFTTTVALAQESYYKIPGTGVAFQFLAKQRPGCTGGGGDIIPLAEVSIFNSRTQGQASYQFTANGGSYISFIAGGGTDLKGTGTTFTDNDINTGKVSTMVRFLNSSTATCGIDMANIPTAGVWSLRLERGTTGQFISEVSTLTTVTAWGNFDSIRNTNGGQVNFFIRTSTSIVNITTQTWLTIAPGAIIGAPTANRFIQWASTIASISTGTTIADIDNVTITHIEGQASDARAFAMDWKNRYWLTVTTNSVSTQRLTYVKSLITNANKDAWMPIDGYPINCYAKSGDVLYGGAVSGGIVYRLDFGTNFDGTPINSIYDTPDMALGDYFFDKYIFKFLIDGSKSMGGIMTVDRSIDQASFVSSTFSISGTGRYSQVLEGVTGKAKTVRLRLRNGQTDVDLGINNLNILYENTGALSNK